MSYVVQIWEQPAGEAVPTSVEESNQLLSRLHRERPGQNPKFILLAQRLTRRYPCILELDEDEVPQDRRAWSEGPLNGETDECVFNLGLNGPMLDEVQPFVVVTARALGLNVADDQQGEVYLADGSVLSMTAAGERQAREFAAAQAAGARRDYRTAFGLLVPLARQGYPEAMNLLAEVVYKGQGVARDFPLAAKWFRRAAEAGHTTAMCSLASMYGEGLGVEPDPARAVDWYRRAAAAGSPLALFNLGITYGNGEGVPRDPAVARALILLARERGVEGEADLTMTPEEKARAEALGRELAKPGNFLVALDRHLALEAQAAAVRQLAEKKEAAALGRARWALAVSIACQLAAFLGTQASLPVRIAALAAALCGIYAALAAGRAAAKSPAWIIGFALCLSVPLFGVLPALVLLIMVSRALSQED